MSDSVQDNSSEAKPFDEALMCGGADARAELARQLATFISERAESSPQRQDAVANLIKLASDPIFEVRRSTAEFLSVVTPLEPELMFTIVADEDEIALPFVTKSPAFDLPRMLAVLKLGDMVRQVHLAARHDLFCQCADYIVQRTDWPACAALLDNPEFEPCEADYRALYRRFQDRPQIMERLLARDDLPLDIRILQAKHASRRIQDYLHAAAFSTADPSELLADAEESATLHVLVQASEAELDKAISFLLTRRMLTPSLLVRAALNGAMHVVEHSLAVLSGIPVKRLQRLFYERGPVSIKAIFNRCRLPTACVRLIQAAREVERLARRSGEDVSSDQFGVRTIEKIVTGCGDIGLHEKMRLLDLVENFGPERARIVAARLKSNLAQAA
ncbi:MAG TPA: DUF2336 domain-containing protein [Aestuariivirgaceae bacterium]